MSVRTMIRYAPARVGGSVAVSCAVYVAPTARSPLWTTLPSRTSPRSHAESADRYTESDHEPSAVAPALFSTVNETVIDAFVTPVDGVVMLSTTRSEGGGRAISTGRGAAAALLSSKPPSK